LFGFKNYFFNRCRLQRLKFFTAVADIAKNFLTRRRQRSHCIENPVYVLPEMKLRGLVPNSYIHVSVSGLFIPRIGLPIWLQQNRQTNPWDYINRSQIHEC
jgi:hypothetical protein